MVDKTSKDIKIAAAVLTGGKSSRMGRPKESVVIPGDGRTFITRICDEVDMVYPETVSGRYLSVRSGQEIDRPGYIIVPDIFDGIGPLGGVASLLSRAKADGYDAVLALAVDLITYDHDEIVRICDHYDGEDVLFTRTEGVGLQPLASIYNVSTFSSITDMIEEGNFRIRDIAGRCKRVGYYDSDSPGWYEDQNHDFQ